jgi:uncharacterized protein YbaR (Trm112 family)
MTVLCPLCQKRMKRHKKKNGPYLIFVCTHGCKGINGRCFEMFVLDDGKDYGCRYFRQCAVMGALVCQTCK